MFHIYIAPGWCDLRRLIDRVRPTRRFPRQKPHLASSFFLSRKPKKNKSKRNKQTAAGSVDVVVDGRRHAKPSPTSRQEAPAALAVWEEDNKK